MQQASIETAVALFCEKLMHELHGWQDINIKFLLQGTRKGTVAERYGDFLILNSDLSGWFVQNHWKIPGEGISLHIIANAINCDRWNLLDVYSHTMSHTGHAIWNEYLFVDMVGMSLKTYKQSSWKRQEKNWTEFD